MENLQPKLLQKPTLLETIVECLVKLLKSQNNSPNTIHKVFIFFSKFEFRNFVGLARLAMYY